MGTPQHTEEVTGGNRAPANSPAGGIVSGKGDVMDAVRKVERDLLEAIKQGRDSEVARILALEVRGASVDAAAGLIRAVMRHVENRTYKRAAGEVQGLADSLQKGVRVPYR